MLSVNSHPPNTGQEKEEKGHNLANLKLKQLY